MSEGSTNTRRAPVSSELTGIHALVIIAAHHGLHLSVDRIARDNALDGEEPSPGALVEIAQNNGLTARVARLRWPQLFKLGRALPLSLRMRDGRSMVLVGVNKEGTPSVVLRDPTSPDGACVVVDKVRLETVWNGDVLFVKRRYRLSDAERPFGISWLAGQMLRERRIFRDIGIAAVLMSLFALFPPLMFMTIVDRVLVHQRLSTLGVLLVGVAFVVVFDTAFGYMRRNLIAVVSTKIDARISTYILDKALALPIDFFERNPTGEITYKLTEVWRIRNFLTGQLFGTMLDTTILFVLLPVMFYLSSALTFYVLGLSVLMTLVVAAYIFPIGRAYGLVVRAEQRKGIFLVETLHGMRTVKSLALEGLKRHDWDVRVAEAVRAQRNMQFLANQPQTILQPIQKAIYLGTLALGSYMAIGTDATIQPGILVAFSMLASQATSPFMQIASLLQQYQEVRGALDQVKSVVNHPPEVAEGRQGVRPEIRGEIVFSDVRFRYPGSQTPALDKVSFHITPGQVIGIMGRSGSGKTTVTRMLQGLHREYDGLIKIDGVDLREIDLYHLRSNFGVVLQDNFLFQGTIRENIMAAKRSASLEEVIRASRMAGAEEFVERLPRGYDTWIEEGSSNLSGGQRQRLAIARALLVDPPVLILDEATSALDPDSEAIINNNLNRIGQGRTMVVISHRLASLVKCDQIMVLERGCLYDMGKHEELLERCDVYRHLWLQQNRHLAPGSAGHERASLVSNTVS